jgi:8-oxo-dGTP pyrophosphatase MutT (NUDIX family)
MPLPRPWQVVETHDLADCTVFTVRRTLARSPETGRLHRFFRIDADEWVNVVAVTREGRLVMVRQYRHGAGALTLEIPGGIVDPGETPARAAVRELLEETGYRAERVQPIGRVNPNPALFGNRVHTYLARGVDRVREIRNGETEATAVELVPVEEIPRYLREGRIDHALVVAALHWYLLTEDGRSGWGSPPR